MGQLNGIESKKEVIKIQNTAKQQEEKISEENVKSDDPTSALVKRTHSESVEENK